jgi:hypothetical protein
MIQIPPEPDNPKFNYVFMGWKFLVGENPRGGYQVVSWHRLHNPETPSTIYSFKLSDSIDYACAWLISHWYEHLLNICPCLGPDKDRDNNFRRAFIEAVLL